MSRKFIFVFPCILGISLQMQAQEDTLDEKTLGEVVISSNKFAERKRYVNQKVEVITSRSIAAINAQNTGDLLVNTGNVFVQKSQQGGSSPVLRGFEASRVLLVIDGIRMNNAIYRAGHLQNIITVDQNILERVEVLYGPGSTLYGSDALGGVIHLRTKSPYLSFNDKLRIAGGAFGRYSTANREKTIHAHMSLAGKKLGWLQSYTFSDFDDMKMGGNYPDDYPGFGRRDSLISTAGGVDNVIANTNTRIQKFSGYRQWDMIQKILFKQNENISHQLSLQLSNSSNIPRYDRLQDKKDFGGSTGTTLRYAEWYYGPQTRWLGYYEMNIAIKGIVDQIRVNANYQHIEESRHQREFRRYDRFDSREENLDIIGIIIDGRKKWNNNELTLGADAQLNDLNSGASRTDLTTGIVSKLDTRYPDGKNRMNYFGLYGQHLIKLAGEKLILNDGLRLQYVTLNSTIIDNSFFNLPFTEISQENIAITGNLGLVYLPSEDFRISFGLSSGFRNPNIDDLSRVFESSTALQRVVIPNQDIRPEYTYNFDLGVTQLIAEKIRFEVTGFYSLFRNAISLSPFQLNGQDSIIYNGIYSAVYANRNNKKANMMGFNGNIRIDFTQRIEFTGTATYTYGRYKKEDGTEIPQDHIPPVYGKASLRYASEKFSTEGFILFNGWKRIKNFNPDGEDNQQYATPDGMPSWLTLNWRNSFKISGKTEIQFAIENILDRNYRYFASGFSAPGRNFIFSLRASF